MQVYVQKVGNMSDHAGYAEPTQEKRWPVAPMVELAGQLREHTGWTWLHSGRVARYAVAFGKELRLDRQTMLALQCGSLLHDIGKVSVPTEVLNKATALTRDEWYTITKHSIASSIMLRAEEIAVQVVSIAQSHHEWHNGQGYPLGLQGEAIPIAARVLSIADAFDAMSSDRPYRPALAPAEISAELNRGSGTQFDPVLVQRLQPVIEANMVEAVEPRVLRIVSDDIQLYKELWFAAYPLGWDLEAWPQGWAKDVPGVLLKDTSADSTTPRPGGLTIVDGRCARRAPEGLIEGLQGDVLWIDPVEEKQLGVYRPLDLDVLLDYLDSDPPSEQVAAGLETIRVLVADPYQLFRQALKECLDRSPGIKVVAEAKSPAEYRKARKSTRYDLVIIASDLLQGTHSTAPLNADDYHLQEGEQHEAEGGETPVIVLMADEDVNDGPAPAGLAPDTDPMKPVHIYRGAPSEIVVDAVRELCRLAKASSSGGN